MNHISSRSLAVLLAAGCAGGGAVIEDSGMQSTGATIGQQSEDVEALDPETSDESAVQAAVSNLGTSLQSLASQHQAYSASQGGTGIPGFKVAQDTANYSFTADSLQMSFSSDIGEVGSYNYNVNLSFAENDLGGRTMSGSYNLDIDAGAGGAGYSYDLDVNYDSLAIDGEGCVVSGGVTVTYDISVVAGGLDLGLGGLAGGTGTVSVTYEGCDVVVVRG